MKKALVAILLVTIVFNAACVAPQTQAPAATPAPVAATPAPVAATPALVAATPAPSENIELIVFAAASMTETLQEIAELYKSAAPNVTLTFNFDSSGTLKTQIQEGATCDVFISAGQLQMNQLDLTASADVNAEKLDYVLQGSRKDILENKIALVVPEGNPKGIQNFAALAEMLSSGGILMAMGNADVPVGQYTQKILNFYDLNEESLAASGVITYGSNVKDVTSQVAEAAVDCGIVYSTDAFSAGLTAVDYATPEMCGKVVYPAAIIKQTANQDAATDFLNFLRGAEAAVVFEAVGFSVVR